MTADAMFNDVSTAAIEQANILLDFLAKRSIPEWEQVFASVLSEQEMELNARNVALALERTKIKQPVGAIIGGTGVAKANAGLEGEDSQRAVRLLKQTGRLIQAGKGRGKALLVLDATPLAADDFAAAIAKAGIAEPEPTAVKPVVAERPDDYVAVDDVPGLLKAAHGGYKDLVSKYNELVAERKVLNREATELNAKVKTLEAEITGLREQLESRNRLAEATTWT